MNYKYTIGQNVFVQMSDHNWVNDFKASAVIIGFEPYVANGIPVYVIKTSYEEIENDVLENRITSREEDEKE